MYYLAEMRDGYLLRTKKLLVDTEKFTGTVITVKECLELIKSGVELENAWYTECGYLVYLEFMKTIDTMHNGKIDYRDIDTPVKCGVYRVGNWEFIVGVNDYVFNNTLTGKTYLFDNHGGQYRLNYLIRTGTGIEIMILGGIVCEMHDSGGIDCSLLTVDTISEYTVDFLIEVTWSQSETLRRMLL